ncbi:putative RNA-directed DNA polymerase [Helianthus anomalus]
MQEELAQFAKLKVWELVDLLKGEREIGTKWVFRCKKDERGIVTRNNARLVVKGFNQQEGIDYNEVFAPVARLEAIHLFLAFAFFNGFKVFQLDVKSAFLMGKSKKWCMSHNQMGSLIQTIQIGFTNLIRLYMDYIKLPGRGTRHCLHI